MSEPFDPFNPEHVKAWHERDDAFAKDAGIKPVPMMGWRCSNGHLTDQSECWCIRAQRERQSRPMPAPRRDDAAELLKGWADDRRAAAALPQLNGAAYFIAAQEQAKSYREWAVPMPRAAMPTMPAVIADANEQNEMMKRRAITVAVGLGLAVLLVVIGVGAWLVWKLP